MAYDADFAFVCEAFEIIFLRFICNNKLVTCFRKLLVLLEYVFQEARIIFVSNRRDRTYEDCCVAFRTRFIRAFLCKLLILLYKLAICFRLIDNALIVVAKSSLNLPLIELEVDMLIEAHRLCSLWQYSFFSFCSCIHRPLTNNHDALSLFFLMKLVDILNLCQAERLWIWKIDVDCIIFFYILKNPSQNAIDVSIT